MVRFAQIVFFVAALLAVLLGASEARPLDDDFGAGFYRPQYDALRGFMTARYMDKRVPNAADMMIRFGKRSAF
uniref:Neuropeptide-Like Protein n=1 Tax=Steinernema glaseri TaxID=37863 RepID=A0A1I7YL09_9BILA